METVHQNATLELRVDFNSVNKEGGRNCRLDDGTLTGTEGYKQGALVENKSALYGHCLQVLK